MRRLLPVLALALAGCSVTVPVRDYPQARLVLMRPLPACVIFCRIVIQVPCTGESACPKN